MTRSWEKAEQKSSEDGATQTVGEPEPTGRTSLQSAVEKFLKNKQTEGVGKGTYYNQDLAIRKQFLAWIKSKSLVYLEEITLEHLEEFRATLPGSAVTRRYKQILLGGFFYTALYIAGSKQIRRLASHASRSVLSLQAISIAKRSQPLGQPWPITTGVRICLVLSSMRGCWLLSITCAGRASDSVTLSNWREPGSMPEIGSNCAR
jgi:hypothetical protein